MSISVEPQVIGDHFLEHVPHSRDLGVEMVKVDKGYACLRLPYRPELLGDLERELIHSGVLTSLADACCGVAVFCALPELQSIATLDLRMDYLRPAVAGQELICTAECFRLTSSIAFARAEITQGSDDALAIAQAAFMRGSVSARRNRVPFVVQDGA